MPKNYCKIPVLNNEYFVVVAFGDEDAIHRLSNNGGHNAVRPDFTNNRGVTYLTDGVYPLIAMPRSPRTPTEYATLAHEACHAVEHIFESIGQPIGGEVFAHSVGAVVREALVWGKPKPRK